MLGRAWSRAGGRSRPQRLAVFSANAWRSVHGVDLADRSSLRLRQMVTTMTLRRTGLRPRVCEVAVVAQRTADRDQLRIRRELRRRARGCRLCAGSCTKAETRTEQRQAEHRTQNRVFDHRSPKPQPALQQRPGRDGEQEGENVKEVAGRCAG